MLTRSNLALLEVRCTGRGGTVGLRWGRWSQLLAWAPPRLIEPNNVNQTLRFCCAAVISPFALRPSSTTHLSAPLCLNDAH